jgi:ligand-binding sensor domain-containing protein
MEKHILILMPRMGFEAQSIALRYLQKGKSGSVLGMELDVMTRRQIHFDGMSRTMALRVPSVGCNEFDDKGMWLGTSNGLSFFNGQTFKNFTQKEGLNDNRILALHYAKTLKKLYVGTSSMINVFEDGKFNSIHVPELANVSVLTLRTYKDASLAIATTGNGVVILDPKTNKRKTITTREGLASDFIYFTGVDDKNYLWVGSEKGINRILLDDQWEIVENLHFNDDNGLTGVETNQNAFYLSPKEKYFGVVDGLYEFNHAKDENTTSFGLHLSDVQILYGEYSAREYSNSTYGFFRIPHNLNYLRIEITSHLILTTLTSSTRNQ